MDGAACVQLCSDPPIFKYKLTALTFRICLVHTYTTVFKKRPNFLNSAPTSAGSALRLLSAPSVCLVKQLKCLCKICSKFAVNLHTHAHARTHTHARARAVLQALSFTLSLIRRTACARAQFSGCSSTTNDHSETEQMAVCCLNLPLGALNSRRALCWLARYLNNSVCFLIQ
jgi:hypothetical protein